MSLFLVRHSCVNRAWQNVDYQCLFAPYPINRITELNPRIQPFLHELIESALPFVLAPWLDTANIEGTPVFICYSNNQVAAIGIGKRRNVFQKLNYLLVSVDLIRISRFVMVKSRL